MRPAILITLVALLLVPSAQAKETKPSKEVRQQARALQTPRVAECKPALRGIAFYHARYGHWMALRGQEASGAVSRPSGCAHARWKALRWRERALRARESYSRWHEYQYSWRTWLPDQWQRIGACETGYGRRPGNWRHSNSSFQGAFGFAISSWDQFKHRADPKAGPYPAEAWQATPRQQYEVALAIQRRYGLSGWGCRGA